MAKAVSRQATGSSGARTGSSNGGRSRNGNGNGGLGARDQEALERLELALRAATAGDFGLRLPARRLDAVGRLEAAYNDLADRNAALEAELVRIGQIIGREGRMTERARLNDAHGA
jgi:hypothetical protein